MNNYFEIRIRRLGNDITYGKKILMSIKENDIEYQVGIAKKDSDNCFTLIIQTDKSIQQETLIVFAGYIYSRKTLPENEQVTYPLFEKFVFSSYSNSQTIPIPHLNYQQIDKGYYYLKCNLKAISKSQLPTSVFSDYEFPLKFEFYIKNQKNSISNIHKFSTFENNFISIFIQANISEQFFFNIRLKSPVKAEPITLTLTANNSTICSFPLNMSEDHKNQIITLPKFNQQLVYHHSVTILQLVAQIRTEHTYFRFQPAFQSSTFMSSSSAILKPLSIEAFKEIRNTGSFYLPPIKSISLPKNHKRVRTAFIPEQKSTLLKYHHKALTHSIKASLNSDFASNPCTLR